jgi:Holliday junction resolvase RusA-like endonuclease
MAMISAADARRLGIRINGTKATARSVKTSEIPADPTKPKGREANRAARVFHAGDSVVVSIDLPFDPKPKERPRTVTNMAAIERAFAASRGRIDVFRSMVGKGTSRTFTPKTTKGYEDLIAIAAAAAMAGRKPFECPVDVRILFTLKGDPEKWPTSAADGDGDNMEKAVLDAMNGIVFLDDRLVVRCSKEKACGPQPRVVIKIEPADPNSKIM